MTVTKRNFHKDVYFVLMSDLSTIMDDQGAPWFFLRFPGAWVLCFEIEGKCTVYSGRGHLCAAAINNGPVLPFCEPGDCTSDSPAPVIR